MDERSIFLKGGTRGNELELTIQDRGLNCKMGCHSGTANEFGNMFDNASLGRIWDISGNVFAVKRSGFSKYRLAKEAPN